MTHPRQHWIIFHLLTAPGIILHEIAHYLACIIVRVPVVDVTLFQLSQPAGSVTHGRPHGWVQWASIALAPLVWNLSVGLLAIHVSLTTVNGRTLPATITGISLLWVGLTSLVHLLPSVGDITHLWEATTASLLRFPLIPLVGLLYLIRYGISAVGTFRVTFPLAGGSLLVMVLSYDISALTLTHCLLRGHWGCWTASPPLESLVSAPIDTIVTTGLSAIEDYFKTIDITINDDSSPPITPR